MKKKKSKKVNLNTDFRKPTAKKTIKFKNKKRAQRADKTERKVKHKNAILDL